MSVTTKPKPNVKKSTPPAAAADRLNSSLKNDELVELYYYMRLMRKFEDTILRLYQQGKIIGGAYSGNGNEATAVGSAYALTDKDYLFPMHRDMGAHLVKGQSVLNLMLQHLGRDISLTHGRDGTGHYSDPSLKIYGNISHLGAMVPVACGTQANLRSSVSSENSRLSKASGSRARRSHSSCSRHPWGRLDPRRGKRRYTSVPDPI